MAVGSATAAYGGACQRQPRRVEALRGERIVATACSDRHALGLTADGLVDLPASTRAAASDATSLGARSLPAAVPLPAGRGGQVLVDCETGYSAAVLDDGSLFTWGGGDYGRLGLGDKQARPSPTLVTLPAGVGRVTHISLGSLYMAACCEYEAPPPPSPDPARRPTPRRTRRGTDWRAMRRRRRQPGDRRRRRCGGDGRGGGRGGSESGSSGAGSRRRRRRPAPGGVLLTWGYGGHGNLGRGDRKDRLRPTVVKGREGGAFAAEACVVRVACTRGQDGCKGRAVP